MADTKKGGSGGGNSIVWSWREVDVRHCTCMSVEAGMYCGTYLVPDGEPPIPGSCGSKCWDLGYIDAATGYFISKGFPLCGGPDAPPLPDPILWPEFLLDNLNRDGVPPCQQRATSAAFKQNIMQMFVGVGEGDRPAPGPVIAPGNGDAGKCDKIFRDKLAQNAANFNACSQKAFDIYQCAIGKGCRGAAAGGTPCVSAECKADATKIYNETITGSDTGKCDQWCQRRNPDGDNPTNPYNRSCEGVKDNSDRYARAALRDCLASPTTSAEM